VFHAAHDRQTYHWPMICGRVKTFRAVRLKGRFGSVDIPSPLSLGIACGCAFRLTVLDRPASIIASGPMKRPSLIVFRRRRRKIALLANHTIYPKKQYYKQHQTPQCINLGWFFRSLQLRCLIHQAIKHLFMMSPKIEATILVIRFVIT